MILTVLLVLVFFLISVGAAPQASDSGTCGPNLYWYYDGYGTLQIYGSGKMDTYGSVPIPWKKYTGSIQKVIVDWGATNLCASFCADALNLTSVSLPGSITEIGSYAFSGCGSLKEVTLPSNLESLGAGAFCDSGITSITLPEKITTINSSVFYDCSFLTSVTAKGPIAGIGSSAFYNCDMLESLSFEQGLTGTIGKQAFAYSDILPTFQFYDGITRIENYAFCGCEQLTDVTFPDSLTSIGDSAFRETAITTITIPNTVTYVGSNAFSYCYDLKDITMYTGTVERIRYSIGLESNVDYAHIIGNAPQTDVKVFLGCKSTFLVYYDEDTYGWTPPKWLDYFIEIWGAEDTSKTGPCGENLTWTLKDNVLTISGTGPMEDYTSKNAPWFVYEPFIKQIVVEDGATHIGNYAFAWLERVTSASIADSVESIGSYGFSNCKNLSELTLGQGVVSLGDYAFNHCRSLTEVTIPGSVESIGRGAFQSCDALQNVVILDGVVSIGSNAFSNNYALRTVTMADSVTQIGEYAFSSCYHLQTVKLSNGLSALPKDLFSSCPNLTDVNIPSNATSIGNSAFYGCKKLTKLSLPEGLLSIGRYAFAYCNLEELDLPASLQSIGTSAFFFCESLHTLRFWGDAPEIENYIFSGVTATVYYPANNDTWTEEVRQLYDGNITWVPFDTALYVEWVSASTTLGGNIGLNFYVILDDALVADETTFIRFTFVGQTIEIPLSEAQVSVKDGVTRYRFTCPLNAKNMTDKVVGQIMNANGAVGKSLSMKVSTYCNFMIQNGGNAELASLMKAMLNYGAAAQILFDYNTGDLANAALSDEDKVLADVDASEFASVITGSEEGIKVSSATLMLETETSVRIYFQLTGSKTISDFTFTVDGEEVTPIEKEGKYYVEIADIAAQDLDETHTIVVGGLSIQYSGLSYVNTVLKNAETAGEALVNAAKAIFAYNKTAEEYFN